ncbi:MAG TPA: nuclear transport factor 2 family protein [Candidatus Binataceae bacterium]|nr:nuclear transport factor 2 family protein [Candidatus Binataceae bacterium]
MSDQEAIIEANRAFYRAFESLEIERMEAIWLCEPRIVCIHPGWRRLTGWGPVMNSWARIFDSAFEMKFELGEIGIMAGSDLAVVVVEENLMQRGYDGSSRSQVLATNIFELVGNKWMMVLHHGSPVIAPPNSEPPLQ